MNPAMNTTIAACKYVLNSLESATVVANVKTPARAPPSPPSEGSGVALFFFEEIDPPFLRTGGGALSSGPGGHAYHITIWHLERRFRPCKEAPGIRLAPVKLARNSRQEVIIGGV